MRRLLYFLRHGKDDYGKLGFNQLMYKGIPLVLSDDLPRGWFIIKGKDGKYRFRKIKMNDKKNR